MVFVQVVIALAILWCVVFVVVDTSVKGTEHK